MQTMNPRLRSARIPPDGVLLFRCIATVTVLAGGGSSGLIRPVRDPANPQADAIEGLAAAPKE
jgi:hypothetical protein